MHEPAKHLTEERAAEILMEEVVTARPLTEDRSEEERTYRRSIRRDVRMLQTAGIEVVVPTAQPDLIGSD